MKLILLNALLLCSAVSQAAPLVAFSTFEPSNRYQIVNVKGEKVFDAPVNDIKRVELRDGLAVVQTSFDLVSLIREDGTILVNSIYGSEFGISKTLLSVFNKGGSGAVYALDGKKLFPAPGESQTRPIQNILIANNRYAVIDQLMGDLTVFGLEGKKLFTSTQSSNVMLSDGFLFSQSSLGSVYLYDAEFNLVTSDAHVSKVQISDEFAGFVDDYGNLKLFSRQAGGFPVILNAISFSLSNTFAIVQDSFGLTLYGKDKSNLEGTFTAKNYSSSHELFAYVGNTGVLVVKNEQSGESFVVNQADSYLMSDDLLVVKNGLGNYIVYSLIKGFFGKEVHSELDHTIAGYQVGNGVFGFQTTLTSGASNSAKVYSIASNGSTLIKSVVIDEDRVNKVCMSINREEWNWK